MPQTRASSCGGSGSGLNRRLLLKAAAAAGGTTLLPTGHGTTPFWVADVMAAQKDDSTLIFLATDTAYSLDPAQNWDYGGGATILSHVYEGLFKFTGAKEAELQPNLAAEIPTLE